MMQPLDPITADEAGKLAMENELLRYEVRHLRARLAAPPEPVAAPTPPTTPTARKNPTAKQLRMRKARQARNRQAYADIVWLVRRLDSSPAGPLLRRVEGFRTLRARYLTGGRS